MCSIFSKQSHSKSEASSVCASPNIDGLSELTNKSNPINAHSVPINMASQSTSSSNPLSSSNTPSSTTSPSSKPFGFSSRPIKEPSRLFKKLKNHALSSTSSLPTSAQLKSAVGLASSPSSVPPGSPPIPLDNATNNNNNSNNNTNSNTTSSTMDKSSANPLQPSSCLFYSNPGPGTYIVSNSPDSSSQPSSVSSLAFNHNPFASSSSSTPPSSTTASNSSTKPSAKENNNTSNNNNSTKTTSTPITQSSEDTWNDFYKFASASRQTDALIYANPRKEAFLQSSHTDINSSSRLAMEPWLMAALRFLLNGKMLFSPRKTQEKDVILEIQGLFPDHWSWQIALDNPSSIVYGLSIVDTPLSQSDRDLRGGGSKNIKTAADTKVAKNLNVKDAVDTNSITDPEYGKRDKDTRNISVATTTPSMSGISALVSSIDPSLSPKSMPAAAAALPDLPSPVTATTVAPAQGNPIISSRRKSHTIYNSDMSVSPRSSMLNVGALDPSPKHFERVRATSPGKTEGTFGNSFGNSFGNPFGKLVPSPDSSPGLGLGPSQSRRPSGQFSFEPARRQSNVLMNPMIPSSDQHARRRSSVTTSPNNGSHLAIPIMIPSTSHSNPFTPDPHSRRPSMGRSTSSGLLSPSSSRRPSASSFGTSNPSSTFISHATSVGSNPSSEPHSRRSSAVSVSSPLVNEITRVSLSDTIEPKQPRSRQGSLATGAAAFSNPFPTHPDHFTQANRNRRPEHESMSFSSSSSPKSSSLAPSSSNVDPDIYTKAPRPRFNTSTFTLDAVASHNASITTLAGYSFQLNDKQNRQGSLKQLLSPSTKPAVPTGPSNYIPCVTQNLLHTPFADNTFDLVSAKSLWSTVKRSDWVPALKELYRILKPGGYLEIIACDFVILNSPKKDTKWWSRLRASVEAHGLDSCPTARVPKHVYDAGFVDVATTLTTLPHGWGGQAGHLTEFLALCHAENLFKIFCGLPQNDIDNFRQDMREPPEKGEYPANQMMLLYAIKPKDEENSGKSENEKGK